MIVYNDHMILYMEELFMKIYSHRYYQMNRN